MKPVHWIDHGPIRTSRCGHYYEITDKVAVLTAIRNRALPLELEMIAVGALYEEVRTGSDRRGEFINFYASLVGQSPEDFVA